MKRFLLKKREGRLITNVENVRLDLEEKLIYTTYDSFEAEQIIAALASGGIPAYKREKGAGQYVSIFLGRNSYG